MKWLSSSCRRLRLGALLGAALLAASGSARADDQWLSAGGNISNTRYQGSENAIGTGTVAGLHVKWTFRPDGDVSATPAVDGTTVYFPDWAGNLNAVSRDTGRLVWKVSIAAASGVPYDKARATPVVVGNRVIVGTQGSILVPGGGPGGKLLAFDKNKGSLLWATQLDSHPAAIVTQSATAFGNQVFVGVASMEEALAGYVPGYPCCSFRGSLLAVDVDTGAINWKTAMAPAGFSGSAVWGSSPAIDPKRQQLYIATGNNYSVPQSVLDCVAAAGSDQTAARACVPADDYFDSVVALDLKTGAVRWAFKALPFDTWTVACFFGPGPNCPSQDSPDFDFGQAPGLFTVRPGGNGQPRDLVGAGQKSGIYWALDPDNGTLVWKTQAGPGGTAGGLQWGSAVDGRRVYTANANSLSVPWTLPDGSVVTTGVWSGLDAATGKLLWQTASPPGAGVGGGASGPATTANGVVFACALDAQGQMVALDGATGKVLWSHASGGSCLSGAAISRGEVFWGSGYGNFGFGTSNPMLYAFTLK